MKRLVASCCATIICVVLLTVLFALWTLRPGEQELRFQRVHAGMAEADVQAIMGSEGDAAGKTYRITGGDRQRVWETQEKSFHVAMVVVFDEDSRVARKSPGNVGRAGPATLVG